MKAGDKIQYFRYPHPKHRLRWQNWSCGEVKYVSPCGRYAIIYAKPSWGLMQDLKVIVEKVKYIK